MGPRLPHCTTGRSTLGGGLSPLLEARQEMCIPHLEAANRPHEGEGGM